MGQKSMIVIRGDTHNVYVLFLATPFTCSNAALWTWNFSGPKRLGVQQDSKQVQGKLISDRVSLGIWQPQEATLPVCTRICFQLRKKAIVLQEIQMTKESCYIFSYSCRFPVLAIYTENNDIKGKDSATYSFFSLQSFLTQQ